MSSPGLSLPLLLSTPVDLIRISSLWSHLTIITSEKTHLQISSHWVVTASTFVFSKDTSQSIAIMEWNAISSLLLDLSLSSVFMLCLLHLAFDGCSSTAQLIIISLWELSLTSMIRWNIFITLLFYVLILLHAFILQHFHNCQVICARMCSRSAFLVWLLFPWGQWICLMGSPVYLQCYHSTWYVVTNNSSFLTKKITYKYMSHLVIK